MKKLNLVKQLALIGIFIIIVISTFLWYKHYVTKDVNQIQKENSTGLSPKLLIIASESPFKDSITSRLIEHYDSTKVVAEVINIKNLENIKIVDFDAVLIMHRWEAGAPHEALELFMIENDPFKNRMVVLTTSWYADEKMQNVDAISGASIVEEVPVFTAKIIRKLNRLLK